MLKSFIFLRNVLGFEKSFLVCFEKCVSAGGYIWKLVWFTSFEKSFQHLRSEQSFLAVYQMDPYFLPSLIANIYKTWNSYSLKNLGDTISKKKNGSSLFLVFPHTLFNTYLQIYQVSFRFFFFKLFRPQRTCLSMHRLILPQVVPAATILQGALLRWQMIPKTIVNFVLI